MNQCDGCKLQSEIKGGLHISQHTERSCMVCQKSKYEEDIGLKSFYYTRTEKENNNENSNNDSAVVGIGKNFSDL